jgi:superfamily II DNA or RNA helicase
MKIEVDTLKSRIITDNPKLLQALINLYSFQVNGAFYTPAYKKGYWDGKQRFISDKGVFRTGLLPRILKDLDKVNIKPNIEYKESKSLELNKEIPPYTLKELQEKYINTILESKRGIIKAPTGFGKSYLIADLIHKFKDYKILILFNRKQILKQLYDLLKSLGFKNIGVAFGEGFIESNIMLCTVQSVEKIIGLPVEKPDILLVDECHEFCQGEFTTGVINSFPSAIYRIGFTATPPTDNIRRYTLEGAFGEVVDLVSTQEAISLGYLAKPIIQVFSTIPETSGTPEDYLDRYDDYIVNNTKRNNLIKNICLNLKHPNPKVAIIVQSLKHAEILNNLIPNSIKIEGKDSLADRNKAIKKFTSTKGLSVLIGTNILQTGVDIKEITYLINVRGLKSDILII